MKTVCIYHSVDLDGWMSAAIVKHWWNTMPEMKSINDALNFLGYNYGQPIPDLSGYDKVIMCDISFPKDIMLGLFDRLDKNFIWIDHHVSAIKDIIGNDYDYLDNVDNSTLLNGLRNRYYAACELTWDFFFPDDDKPEIVRLLGMYDSFRHKGTDEEQKVLEFQYGARAFISNYEEAYKYLIDKGNNFKFAETTVEAIHQRGIGIYQYLCTEAKQSYKNGFSIYFRYSPDIEEHRNLGFTKDTIYRFVCINKERFNPVNFGIDYHKDGYDGAACFHYDGVDKLWKFSLYNDNGLVDCSVIAKQFGGGGHKGAAGFVIDDISRYGCIFDGYLNNKSGLKILMKWLRIE